MTEDYSSYESVDEREEPEPAARLKDGEMVKPSTKAKAQDEDNSTSDPPRMKKVIKPGEATLAKRTKTGKAESGTSKGKQKSLNTFFSATTRGKA